MDDFRQHLVLLMGRTAHVRVVQAYADCTRVPDKPCAWLLRHFAMVRHAPPAGHIARCYWRILEKRTCHHDDRVHMLMAHAFMDTSLSSPHRVVW